MAFNNTLGALLLGQTFSAVLCGITLVQVIQFHKTSGKDSVRLKILVCCLWILDVIHQAFLIQGTYNLLVQNFGNFGALDHLVWGTEFALFITGINNLLCQLFMCRRVWTLWKSERRLIGPLVAIILLFAVVAFFTNFAYAIIGWRTPGHLVSGFNTRTMQILIYITHTLEIMADVLITGSLVFYLQRGQATFNRTKSLIATITAYIISSCLLTTVVQIMVLVAYAVWPNNFIYYAFYTLLPKVYFNSLLATLNSRVSATQSFQDASSRDDIQLHSSSYSREGGISQNRPRPAIIIGIGHQVEAMDEQGKKMDMTDGNIESD